MVDNAMMRNPHMHRGRIVFAFDYLSVLRASPPWDQEPDPAFIPFSHEDASTAELAALAEKWSIESIAGSGDGFDRMRNLMAWVNDVTTQEGSAPVPSPKTADRFLTFSTDGSDTRLNCLATAITLAEVLLADGIPARTLMMYAASASNDVHVVVIAWSDELSKWVYLDPSYNAWFAESDGSPMSPLEIREGFQSGADFQVSPGSGWNGGRSTSTTSITFQ
jgi:hypothetical protein